MCAAHAYINRAVQHLNHTMVGIGALWVIGMVGIALQNRSSASNWLPWAFLSTAPIVLIAYGLIHELISARKRLQNLESYVSVFHEMLRVTGHDLRGPLMNARASAELLRMKALPERDLIPILDGIARQVWTVSDSVDNTLDVLLLTNGKFNWDWERFNIHDLISEAMRGITTRTSAISISFDTGTPDFDLHGDRQALVRTIKALALHQYERTQQNTLGIHVWPEVKNSKRFVKIEIVNEKKAKEKPAVWVAYDWQHHPEMLVFQAIVQAHGGVVLAGNKDERLVGFSLVLRSDLNCPLPVENETHENCFDNR